MTELHEGRQVSANPRRRILWLALSHVAIGLSAGMLSAWCDRSAPELTVAVLFGLVFSQMSLLGIWGGLGTSSWWKRLLSGIAGIGYLGLLTGFGVDEAGSEMYVTG